jgi:hypothetical protein
MSSSHNRALAVLNASDTFSDVPLGMVTLCDLPEAPTTRMVIREVHFELILRRVSTARAWVRKTGVPFGIEIETEKPQRTYPPAGA